ncbi:unnamed protein product [Prorocentrum cordatum]|uniref:Uncharacterized protein n=1 Tax=Prorocentrum cordatum TaxID=2364126 RepID=A0ABN9XGP1_9DINO|nr:unnamed protein product [Polarella glacialis]
MLGGPPARFGEGGEGCEGAAAVSTCGCRASWRLQHCERMACHLTVVCASAFPGRCEKVFDALSTREAAASAHLLDPRDLLRSPRRSCPRLVLQQFCRDRHAECRVDAKAQPGCRHNTLLLAGTVEPFLLSSSGEASLLAYSPTKQCSKNSRMPPQHNVGAGTVEPFLQGCGRSRRSFLLPTSSDLLLLPTSSSSEVSQRGRSGMPAD